MLPGGRNWRRGAGGWRIVPVSPGPAWSATPAMTTWRGWGVRGGCLTRAPFSLGLAPDFPWELHVLPSWPRSLSCPLWTSRAGAGASSYRGPEGTWISCQLLFLTAVTQKENKKNTDYWSYFRLAELEYLGELARIYVFNCYLWWF